MSSSRIGFSFFFGLWNFVFFFSSFWDFWDFWDSSDFWMYFYCNGFMGSKSVMPLSSLSSLLLLAKGFVGFLELLRGCFSSCSEVFFSLSIKEISFRSLSSLLLLLFDSSSSNSRSLATISLSNTSWQRSFCIFSRIFYLSMRSLWWRKSFLSADSWDYSGFFPVLVRIFESNCGVISRSFAALSGRLFLRRAGSLAGFSTVRDWEGWISKSACY